jgi:phage terminase large subunit-like protein
MPPKKLNLEQMMLQIAEEIEAGARLPNIKKYSPHEKQLVFHSSAKKKKLYIGGNRSGKTTGGVTEAIWRATCTHPYRPELNAIGPNRGRVVAVDFVQGVEKIIFPQYKQWLYPSAIKGGSWTTAYSPSTRTLTFSNGSTIEFMSYDQQLDKFAGTSRHWTHFDEEPPKPIWLECLARLVDTNGEWWLTMTPVEGMTWIYDDLYEPNIALTNAERSVEIIEINTLENPYLTQEGIQNLVESMGDEDTVTRIGGGFVRQGGRIYKNFDPTPGSLHVLPDSIRDPKTYFPSTNWLWILSLDHGLNNPTAVLWIAVNDDGFCVVFDEWYKSEFTVEQHAEVIKRKIKEHGRFPDLLVADPAIVQRSGITSTSIQEEYQKYGLSFILGNNDVKSGLIRVKKYFNQHPYPGSKERRHPLYGGSRIPSGSTDSVTYADPTNSQRYPRLLVDPRCQKLIWELKRYRWKTYSDKKKQYENNPYDEPHKKDDHACDSLRYAIMTRPDLAANNNETSEAEIREAMREINMGVSRVNDWDIADPNGIYSNADSTGWRPGNPISSSDGWDYDEHMGNIF